MGRVTVELTDSLSSSTGGPLELRSDLVKNPDHGRVQVCMLKYIYTIKRQGLSVLH